MSEDSQDGPAEPSLWGATGHGVGPWKLERGLPLPEDPQYDPELLRDGDARNVVDAYRYWRREAIVADIDRRRHRLHIAIENFENDANIGTVVRRPMRSRCIRYTSSAGGAGTGVVPWSLTAIST